MSYHWSPQSLDDMTLKRWERLREVNKLMAEIREEADKQSAPPPTS